MTVEVKKETWRGPFVARMPDGRAYTTERDVIVVDDWRMTPIGPVNFGHVQLLPTRMIEITRK